jgi:phenylalanyl-tRNA synthetase beta chain
LAEGWRVTPPGFRFDIAMEADLIEEIGRVYGYNNIPKSNPASRMELQAVSEALLDLDRVKDLLVGRGYQEAITYSFVEPAMLAKIEPELETIALLNPISSDLAVMRTGLWCGLLDAALKNLNRQQVRVRLFEAGLRFTRVEGNIIQEKSLAGLALGSVREEQWGEKTRPVDFFDMKADVEAILRLVGHERSIRFVGSKHPALHPGQSAEIILDGQRLGQLGMLHPKVERELGFESRVFLFELDQNRLLNRSIPAFKPLSKFPQVRRDIAIIVGQLVTAAALCQCVENQSPLIRQVLVFDVYQGAGIETGNKSVALGLVLQDDVETLTDAKVDEIIADVLAHLAEEFNAKLRN